MGVHVGPLACRLWGFGRCLPGEHALLELSRFSEEAGEGPALWPSGHLPAPLRGCVTVCAPSLSQHARISLPGGAQTSPA